MYSKHTMKHDASIFDLPLFEPPGPELIQKPLVPYERKTQARQVQNIISSCQSRNKSNHHYHHHSQRQPKKRDAIKKSPVQASTSHHDHELQLSAPGKPEDDIKYTDSIRAHPQPLIHPHPRPYSQLRPLLRPLAPCKIHALKSAYESFQTANGHPTDHAKQTRLSRALEFALSKPTPPLVPPPPPPPPPSSTTSLATPPTHSPQTNTVPVPSPPRQRPAHLDPNPAPDPDSVPTILRAGRGPTSLSTHPVLVRWTGPTTESRALYTRASHLPPAVRRLLLGRESETEWEGWEPPFGNEGRDWLLDVCEGRAGDGGGCERTRVWVRDVRREARWGGTAAGVAAGWWKLEV